MHPSQEAPGGAASTNGTNIRQQEARQVVTVPSGNCFIQPAVSRAARSGLVTLPDATG